MLLFNFLKYYSKTTSEIYLYKTKLLFIKVTKKLKINIYKEKLNTILKVQIYKL